MDFDDRCRPGTAAQLKILPSSVNFPEYYLEIEMGATSFSHPVLLEPQGNHI